MSLHCMIDLETLSTHNFATILSIGACKFDPQGSTVEHKFHVYIEPASCERSGMRISADTVDWWMDAGRDSARKQLMDHKADRVDLMEALLGFTDWYGTTPMPTWGNGSDFDNVILANAYKLTALSCPWDFWDNRCFRTLKNLGGGIAPPRACLAHDALADAVYQAESAQMILRHLGILL